MQQCLDVTEGDGFDIVMMAKSTSHESATKKKESAKNKNRATADLLQISTINIVEFYNKTRAERSWTDTIELPKGTLASEFEL